MPRSVTRFATLQRVAKLVLFVDLVAAFVAIALAGYALGLQKHSLAAILGLGGVGALVFGALGYVQVVLMHKFESNTYRLYDSILDLTEQARRQTDLVRTMADNTSLSDWAKKIVFHEKDHEYLRDAILGAMIRQDWEAADHLIRAMAEELGYVEEARQLRADADRARQATIEQRVEAALKRFDDLCEARKWDQARRDAVRLRKIFPDNERIAGLAAEVELRRQQYKRSLLKEYDQAARRNDFEHAAQLIVELDQYLAANEGAALRDSARGVFKAKLMQMGVQFSLAVSDKQYSSAIEIGEKIVRDYPNSRYSHEIADMLPVLRRRMTHD